MRKRIACAWVSLVSLAVVPASAQVAETFRVAPAESSVLIHVGAAGMLGFLGHNHEIAAPAMNGTIEVNRSELARSTVAIEFQAQGLRVTGKGEPAADVPDVQRTMQGEQVLDAEHHPSIFYRSREIVMKGKATGQVSVVVRGDLTLRGVTRPVDVTGTVVLTEDTLTMKGTARVRQTDFGLRPVTAAGGTVRVKDELDAELVIVAHATGPAPAELDRGFGLLYGLHFTEARGLFHQWQHEHPSDPMGYTAEAASDLFEEFSVHGVLTSEFFLDDDRLLGGIVGEPDAERRSAFLLASERARQVARQKLRVEPGDVNALLSLTMTTGMLANHASLIDKRQLESLRLVREAEGYGKRLLAASPEAADGYVALGAARYIIGCLPGYKRALLWLGGVTGDRQKGMDHLALAASRGRYLRPYAKAMLFLASLREGQTTPARALIEELTAEFPDSALFARERAKLGP